MHRFSAEGRPGLIDHKPAAAAIRLSDAQAAESVAIVETGSDRADDGVVRRRHIDLKRIINPVCELVGRRRHGCGR